MPFDPPLSLGDYQISVIVTSPPWYENCYLVKHVPSGEQLVIDPGSDAERILAQLAAGGGKCRAILLTHGHPDHIGAARRLQTELGIPCRAHADERPVIESAAEIARALMGMRLEAPACDWLADAPGLTLGGVPVGVIATPGHTPGGVCYAFGGFTLTGDTLFNHGIGRTDLPGGDYDQLAASIEGLLAQSPDDTVMFSGHGPDWTAGQARAWWRTMA